MATPSSSATSPSPPMPYLHHAPGAQQAPQPAPTDTVEREQRKKAVQKFLARAEVAMVTRALRARLSYASYKATHNIPHVPLRDLEAQSQSQAASFTRTIAAKRKAVGATHHHSTPSIPGPSSSGTGAGSLRRGGSGSMAPPASTSSPRTHASSIHGTTAYSGYPEVASGLRNASQVPNLYSSILAPPPTKQGRTVHNPNDPPVPAPSRPHESPRSRTVKASPRNDPARQQAKNKQPSKSTKAPPSPNRRRTKGGSVDKGKKKQKQDDMDVDVDGERDLKAAATLTSLLLHNRPSIAGSASSPRSSIDGSDVGSVHSYSHFAQSSTRTSATHPPAPLSAAPSSSTIIVEPPSRTQTPPPPGSGNKQQTTPRAAPTDNEAANLMLFLATSPSPARPTNKDSRDMAAYRALGGGATALRSKGRVLFPSTAAGDPAPSRQDEASAGTAATSYRTPALARGGESSFASSISSIAGELGGSKSGSPAPQNASTTPSTSAPGFASSSAPSLLPPAHVPLPSAPTSPAGRKDSTSSPRPTVVGVPCGGGNPGGPLDFNINEFINASPSPSRGAHGGYGPGGAVASAHKSNLGLRADVGRKLFEEEQMRHAHALQAAAAAAAAAGIGSPGRAPRQEERALGAGIDLVQQS